MFNISAKVTSFLEKQKHFPIIKTFIKLTEDTFPPATLLRGMIIDSIL